MPPSRWCRRSFLTTEPSLDISESGLCVLLRLAQFFNECRPRQRNSRNRASSTMCSGFNTSVTKGAWGLV